MKIVIIIFMIILFMISILLERRLYNPLTIFVGLWMSLLILASFRLFNLYKINAMIYICIFISTLGFFGGFFLIRYVKVSAIEEINVRNITKYIVFIAVVFSLYYIREKIGFYIMGYSLSDVRYSAELSDINKGRMLNILYTYFASPIIQAAAALYSCKFLIEQKWKYMPLPVALAFLIVLGNGAREIVIYLTLIFAMAILILRKNDYKLKCRFKLLIFLGVIIFVIMTKSRSRNGLFASLYYYVCGALVVFDGILETSLKLNYTNGMSSFMGIARPLNSILEIMGESLGKSFDVANNFIWSLQYNIIYVAPGVRYNYFATCFAYFMKDFGIFGLVFIGAIYGSIVCLSYKKINRYVNVRYLTLYTYFISGIIVSMMDFQFSNIRNIMTIVFIIILTGNRKTNLIINLD